MQACKPPEYTTIEDAAANTGIAEPRLFIQPGNLVRCIKNAEYFAGHAPGV
jgi:hypothetical protein